MKIQNLLWFAVLSAVMIPVGAHAQVYNVKSDWSDSVNPSGTWSYTDEYVPLPHVSWWQRVLGGWTSAQPAWSKSEDANNRLPMFYKSNGTETFGADIQAGDIVEHTWDPTNGAGTGQGILVWTAPRPAIVHIIGSVWLPRDIGRANDWSLQFNRKPFTGGQVFTGDPYSRANPMNFSQGTGGASVLQNIYVDTGEVISLNPVASLGFTGDFIGINMSVIEDSTLTRVSPVTATVKLGRLDLGNAASLANKDGNYYRVCKFLVPNQQVSPITVELSGVSPSSSLTKLVFRTNARMQQSGSFSQTLDLFDFSTNLFSNLDIVSDVITTATNDLTVSATGNVSRYVGPGNEIRARYRIKQTGPTSTLLWCSETDKAVWLVLQ